MQKSNQANAQRQTIVNRETRPKKIMPYNSTYPKVGVSCSKDPDASGWLITRRGVLRINICAKNHSKNIAKIKNH